MVSGRMTMVLAMLDRDKAPQRAADHAAATMAATVLGVDGITAAVGTGPAGPALAWGTGAVSAEVEQLQFTLGQGPGVDAASTGAPVLAPDLAADPSRWPGFAPAAAALGVRAVFAFPMQIGAISVGSLLAHRCTAGPLVNSGLIDALVLADAVTVVLIHRRSGDGGHAESQAPTGWATPSTYRAEVHQATGMISVQLGVGLAEALVRLRAHAFGRDRLIADVAADVVARRLRFDD
jgi:GAF domain-containing protein